MAEASIDHFNLELQANIVFDWMEANNVPVLQVPFDGSGDSGCFNESVECIFGGNDPGWEKHKALEEILKTTPVRMERYSNQPETLYWLIVQMSVNLEDKTDHGVDWWNNDGGEGFVEWILDGVGSDGETYKRGIMLQVSEREMRLNTDHYALLGCIETSVFDGTKV